VNVGLGVAVGKGVYVGNANEVGKGVNVGLGVAVGKGVYVDSGTKVVNGAAVGSSGVGICIGVPVGGGTTTTIEVGGGVGVADEELPDPFLTITKARTAAMTTMETVTPATIETMRPLLPVLGRLSTWRWATSPSLLMKNCSCPGSPAKSPCGRTPRVTM
jgi:hypothetical protein